MKNENKEEKEPWDTSSEKAKTLKIDDFGIPEEVREMAKINQMVNTRKEARSILEKLVNKPLKSKAGIIATISLNSIDKLLSGKSANKSYNAKAHFLAVANLEKLFANAIEPYKFTLISGKNNENYSEVKRMYAPMYFEERIIPVKFTVKVMLNEKEGKRIYSLEAIDADLDKK
jgi:hypothetical protein